MANSRREGLRQALGKAEQDRHSTHAVQQQYTGSTQARLKRYDVRLSAEDWQRLGAAADTEGSSRGAIIRRLVRQYLRQL